ncbi:glycosyltransferase domain-containing protein [Salinibacterium hongtaonis]|uniref:glycosyltransferase domain-containing protein n=1 Tax=Homoserinimonas hongtaonis TaxID=2079791 RepID=UPI000D3478E1|nr:glycosyltransferase domain-containing protein [Salinibacterium hongtaonis]AWB88628.1 hypothetical protein C2138_02865 [Salinibacterium hongtaonis]
MSSASPRRVLYTALMGQYEKLNEQPLAHSSTVDFVCFTDDPELTSETWKIRLVEPRFPMDSIRSARYFKTRGYTLFADYDESLWIDNSVRLRVTPEVILDSWLVDADIAIPRHSFRKTVIGEFDTVATDGYDDPARVYEQLIHYSSIRPNTLQELPYWTALVARRHTAEVDAAMSLWHDHILRYSRRDQLSINFVAGSTALPVKAIEIDNLGSEWHEWPVRAERKWSLTQDRLANALRVPSVEVGRLENDLNLLKQQIAEAEKSQLQEVEKWQEDVAVAREELHQIYRSTLSWRLTQPLRAVSTWIGRARRRG